MSNNFEVNVSLPNMPDIITSDDGGDGDDDGFFLSYGWPTNDI